MKKTFKAGDIVTSQYHDGSWHVGLKGIIVAGPDGDGDYLVKFKTHKEHQGHGPGLNQWAIPPAKLTRVDIVASKATTASKKPEEPKADAELIAIAAVLDAVKGLSGSAARKRVLSYVGERS